MLWFQSLTPPAIVWVYTVQMALVLYTCTCICIYTTYMYMYMYLHQVHVHVHVSTPRTCTCICIYTTYMYMYMYLHHVHVHVYVSTPRTCTVTAVKNAVGIKAIRNYMVYMKVALVLYTCICTYVSFNPYVYNFRMVNASKFLFSKHHTTHGHGKTYGSCIPLHITCGTIARSDTTGIKKFLQEH